MLLYVILIIAFILFSWLSYLGWLSDKKQQKERFEAFLLSNNGIELFCYTNRKRFCEVIEEEIIPSLDKSINIVKLNGKEPQTELDKEMISYALYRIKNIGFPNVMKIVNGKLIDLSMHKEVYDCINNGKSENLAGIVSSKFKEIRNIASN